MLCAGSLGFVTPRPAAVAGMSCVRPVAPAGDLASALKFDSWRMSPRSSAGSTPLRAAAASISAANGVAAPVVAVVPVVAVGAAALVAACSDEANAVGEDEEDDGVACAPTGASEAIMAWI